MANRFALQVKKLYDGTMDPGRDAAIVVVEDGNIADVFGAGEREAFARKYPDVTVEDLGDKYMTPGLIDSHVHIISPPGLGVTVMDQYTEYDTGELTLFAAQNCQIALKRGVTTLRDCGCQLDVAISVKKMIERGNMQGPDLIISGYALTSTGGPGEQHGGAVDGVDDIIKLVRKQWAAGCDFCKLMATGSGGKGRGANFINFTKEEVRAAVDEAHRLEMKASAHVCSTEGALWMLDSGIDSYEHCLLTTGYDVDYPEGIVEKMLSKNIIVCHTLQILPPAIRLLEKQEQTPYIKSEIARISKLHNATLELNTRLVHDGMVYIAGSDAGWKDCAFGELWEGMDLLCQCGASPLESLHTATGRAAEFNGLDKRLGTVKPGLQADLLIVDEDPMKSMTNLSKVNRVYKKGERVV